MFSSFGTCLSIPQKRPVPDFEYLILYPVIQVSLIEEIHLQAAVCYYHRKPAIHHNRGLSMFADDEEYIRVAWPSPQSSGDIKMRGLRICFSKFSVGMGNLWLF
jgi:hypothetical protein